jgi:hypothetical protein
VISEAKAPSAGSTQPTGSSRGPLRRALATRGARDGSQGTGAPAPKLIALLAIALVALFATAGPASAASPTATCCTISNVSYGSAHLTGKITSSGGKFGSTSYSFQYSKDPDTEGWNPGPGGVIFGGALNEKEVFGDLENLKGATEYFVRLTASSFEAGEGFSPAPYPSFTTLAVDPPTIPGAVEASGIFSTSATATAKVKRPANENAAFDVNCHFEYISDTQFLANEGKGDPGFTGAEPIPCTENPITKDSVDAEGEQAVTAPLTGLSPATAYHLRLVAENASPDVVTKDAATTFTTEPPVAKPVVIATDDAKEVGIFTAQAEGEVERPAGADPALDVSCHFEYISDQQFDDNVANNGPGAGFEGAAAAYCAEPITSPDPGHPAVSADVKVELTGLKPETTYHLRLAAENGGGTETKDAVGTFTTLEAEKPTVTIDPVAGGTYTTAHVSATVDVDDPGYDHVFYSIESSTDGGLTWSGFFSGVNEFTGTGPHVVQKDFTGLQPSTTYTFRIVATYSGDPPNPPLPPRPPTSQSPTSPPPAPTSPPPSIPTLPPARSQSSPKKPSRPTGNSSASPSARTPTATRSKAPSRAKKAPSPSAATPNASNPAPPTKSR